MNEELKKLLDEQRAKNLTEDEYVLWNSLLDTMSEEEKVELFSCLKELAEKN